MDTYIVFSLGLFYHTSPIRLVVIRKSLVAIVLFEFLSKLYIVGVLSVSYQDLYLFMRNDI